jgi:ATP-dependent exoDNAse (exonuclease V) beta subunit
MPFFVFKSSAGSGKTFTLVKEYLKIILANPADFRRVLAITFTNKAANEMKVRILKTLDRLSDPGHDRLTGSMRVLQKQLINDTGLTSEEIAERSAKALGMILHHYSEFAVGTIDSFSQRIIRSFAHDFGLPVSFNVEINDDELLETAVDLMLSRTGEDQALTTLLVSFLESRMDQDGSWDIAQLLFGFAKATLMDEEGQEHIARLRQLSPGDFTVIAGDLYKKIREFESRLIEEGKEGIRLIGESGIPRESFYRKDKGVISYLEKLAAGRLEKFRPNSYVTETFTEGRWLGPKAPPADSHRFDMVSDQLGKLAGRLLKFLDKYAETYTLNRMLRSTIHMIAVLHEIEKELNGYKRENNLVLVSEFNKRISGIVMKEPVPFIYERLGEKYQHILIDEFQDTSQLQWQNFVPLMENGLSGGGTGLVVGDGKQAIYRWRNGDVTQFAALPGLRGSDSSAVRRHREQVLRNHCIGIRLPGNYRSGKTIIDFNNRFFEYLSSRLDPSLQSIYEGLKQEDNEAKEGGYILIEFFEKNKGNPGYTGNTILRIVEIIRNLRADQYRLNDIAILCRTNDIAGRIARSLIPEGIPVISSESLLLAYSPEVRFIVDMIRFLFQPAHLIIQAGLISYLCSRGNLPLAGLDGLIRKLDEPGYPGKGFRQILDRYELSLPVEKLVSMPVYDLCEELIRLFDLNREADPYIGFFLDAVLEFMKGEALTAPDFLEWWENYGRSKSVKISEGIDAVQVMTIHKAKGLEFPVVIFPFAQQEKKLSRDYLWVDLPEEEYGKLTASIIPATAEAENTRFAGIYREEEMKSELDMINVLYVAMTRPKTRLYILTQDPPSTFRESLSYPSIFAGFLDHEGMWNEEVKKYEFGQQVPETGSGQAGTTGTVETHPVISGNWRDKIRIRARAPGMWDVEDPDGRQDRGIRIHTLMSGIGTVTGLQEAVDHAISSGLIRKDEVPFISSILEQVISHPLLKEYYSDRVTVRAEQEILFPDGRILRPDRLVEDGKDIVIIEYKTGKKQDSYKEQLKQYEAALHDMGYGSVIKYLVYLHDPVEVERFE